MRRRRQSFCKTTWTNVRKLLYVGSLLVVLLAAAAGLVLWRGWNDLHEPYKGYSGTEQFVTIRQGASSSEIGRQLASAQVLRDARSFRAAAWWTGRGRRLKAGELRGTERRTVEVEG